MVDPRIPSYRQAVADLREGRYRVEVPAGAEDEVGQLGREIESLAHTLERRFLEHQRITEITARVNKGFLLDEVLASVYETFRPLIPYDRIGLALLEDGGDIVRARWARSEAPTLRLTKGYDAPLAGSSLETLLAHGRPRILNDLERYLEEHPGSHSTRLIVGEGMRSSLTCPLIALGQPMGFLFFSSMTPNTYEGVHQDVFLQIAEQLAVIVDKSRTYQEVLRLNQQLERARNEMEVQATHDPLTGIWNRGAILAFLRKELERARREEQPITVALADLDHFKDINDRVGHQAGDRALQQVAEAMQASLRASEALGRYGGEEFLFVLWPAGEPEARTVLDRVQTAVQELTLDIEGERVSIRVSQGAAVCLDPARVELDDLIRAADKALYRAKQAGRDRYELVRVPEGD